ncbi:MAG: hypothetical protein R8M38_03020 [Mariprofundaceae bacterium]
MMKKNIFWRVATAFALLILMIPNPASASECGLSCCIAAGVDGVSGNTGFSITAQYELMQMRTILSNTTEVAAESVIQAQFNKGGSTTAYSVPTDMTMQKLSINASWRIDEDNALVLTVPYIINNMDMRMGMKMGSDDASMGGSMDMGEDTGMDNTMPSMSRVMAEDMPSFSHMAMDTVSGIGDVSLVYLRDIYKDTYIRTRQRLSLGVGIKAPTGNHTMRSKKNSLVHMMMQPGTGSWDGLLIANGVLSFGEYEDGGARFMLSPSLIYQLSGRNGLGYKLGDRLNVDLSARYRLNSIFNFKIDLNGVWSGQDDSDGTIDETIGKVAYQDPMQSMLDDISNTGVTALYITPGFQWVVNPEWVVSAEYRVPVMQRVRGTQIVTDNWFFMRASVRF